MQLNTNNSVQSQLKLISFFDNNFNNYQKNNIKMNKIKKLVKRTFEKTTPNENISKLNTTESSDDKKDFKVTQYPLIKKSIHNRHNFKIYQQDLIQEDFEKTLNLEKERKMFILNKNNTKIFPPLIKSEISTEKRNLYRKILPRHRLFNKSPESKNTYDETVKIESYKDLLIDIEKKHHKIVEKLRKNNVNDSNIKLPYVCMKSDKGIEGTLLLNYAKTEANTEDTSKRNKSKNIYKRASQGFNINSDGEVIFKRIFEKNFRINNRTLGGLNL